MAVKLIVSVAKKNVKPYATSSLRPLDAYLASLSASRAETYSSVDVFEIEGHPGSGKTHLFYILLADCISPEPHAPTLLHGPRKISLVFDMDAQFDLGRFRDLLIAQVQSRTGNPQQSTEIIDRCLEGLHIFKPSSSEQLLASLVHLPKLLRDRFPDSSLGVIAIHSLEAFYWSDRFKIEPRTRAAAFPGKSSIYQKVYSCLRTIQETYQTRLIISHSGLNQVLQHHPSQHASTQDPVDSLDNNSTKAGGNNSSTLFLTVQRVLGVPDIAPRFSSSRFRVMGKALAAQEPVVFDILITPEDGVVLAPEKK